MFREGCELRLRHIYMGTQRGRLCNVEMTELRGPRVKLGILCGLEFGFVHVKKKKLGFPGGAVVENPPANAGDTGSSPGLGGSHMPRSN